MWQFQRVETWSCPAPLSDLVLTRFVQTFFVLLGYYDHTQVAWIHYDRSAILTVQNNVITRNPRIGVSHDGHSVWNLHIRDVERSDEGQYMCQINTDPMRHRSGYFEVVGNEYIRICFKLGLLFTKNYHFLVFDQFLKLFIRFCQIISSMKPIFKREEVLSFNIWFLFETVNWFNLIGTEKIFPNFFATRPINRP